MVYVLAISSAVFLIAISLLYNLIHEIKKDYESTIYHLNNYLKQEELEAIEVDKEKHDRLLKKANIYCTISIICFLALSVMLVMV